MDFALSAEQQQIRDSIFKLCARFDDNYWLEKDRTGEFPHELHGALAEAGWLGIAMPQEYGGAGLGITEATIMMQAIAEADRGQFLRGAFCGVGIAGELQRHRDVLQRRHGRDQVERLEDDADLPAAETREIVLVEGIERGAIDHHLSAVRTLQTRHHHQQGRLPRA